MNLSIARKYIEKLYIDTCTIIEYQEVTDEENHITNMQEVIVYEDVPCKLSYQTIKMSGEDVASSLNMVAKLIISPDIIVKSGSKINITRNGVTTSYKNSGEPAQHLNHQEIILKLFDRWA